MRISDWSSDVCSSDLKPVVLRAKVRVFIELYRQAEQERLLLEENFRIRNDYMKTERQLRSTERREAMVFRQLPIAVYEVQTDRSEEHTSELQSLMRISYAVFCLKKKITQKQPQI